MQIFNQSCEPGGVNSGYGWQLRNIEKINGVLMIGGQDIKYVLYYKKGKNKDFSIKTFIYHTS